jgi:hypothetical protein
MVRGLLLLLLRAAAAAADVATLEGVHKVCYNGGDVARSRSIEILAKCSK